MRRRLAALVSCALLAAGCSGGSLPGPSGRSIAILPASSVPGTMAGLSVRTDDVRPSLRSVEHSYVDAIGFYSLRSHRQVEATLEVARFGRQADYGSAAFRSSVAGGVEQAAPEQLSVRGAQVYQASGTRSTIDVWFSGPWMMELTVLGTYKHARSLLEAAVAASPGRQG